jgi:hypothetical protein
VQNEFEFNYTPDDLKTAAKIISSQGRASTTRFGRGIFGWILFIGLAITLYFIESRKGTASSPIPQIRRSPAIDQHNVLVFYISLALAITFVISWIFFFRQARKRTLLNHPALQERQKLEILESGLTLSTSLASTHWQWAAFDRVVDAPVALLLRVQKNNTWIMIPKRLIGPESNGGATMEYIQSRITQRTGP